MRWSFYAIFMRKLVSNQPCWVTGGTDRKVKKKIFFFRGRHNFLYRSELVLGIGSLLSLSVYTYIRIYMCKCIYAYIRIYKIYVYIYIFFAALEFQLRVSWFLGRCSTTCATLPALFVLGIFQMSLELFAWGSRAGFEPQSFSSLSPE
jgi:hypothetical protein